MINTLILYNLSQKNLKLRYIVSYVILILSMAIIKLHVHVNVNQTLAICNVDQHIPAQLNNFLTPPDLGRCTI